MGFAAESEAMMRSVLIWYGEMGNPLPTCSFPYVPYSAADQRGARLWAQGNIRMSMQKKSPKIPGNVW